MLTPRFDRDLLNNLATKKAATATLKALDAIQRLTPEEQVAGLAAAFLLVCEGYKVPPQDAYRITTHMMNHHNERGLSEFDAVRSYLEADVFRTKPND